MTEVVVMGVLILTLPPVVLLLLSRPVLLTIMLVSGSPLLAAATFLVPSQQRAAESVRDALVIVTTMVCLWSLRGRGGRALQVAVISFLIMAAYVLLSMFFPTMPSTLVGIVGARAWLLYPMMIVPGYYAFISGSVTKVLRMVCIIGLPVVILGIFDASLGAAGRPSVLSGLHLDSQSVAAQLDAGFDIGEGRLTRVSTVFPFPLAYFVFTAFYTVAALHCSRMDGARRNTFLIFAGLGAAACLSSGTRLALVVVPVIAIFGVNRLASRSILATSGVALVGLYGFATLTGIRILELPTYLWDLARQELADVLVNGMAVAVSVTTFGRGAGTDTNAARDVVEGDLFAPIGGRWQESLLAKSWIELGFVGLVLVTVILVALLRALLAARKVDNSLAPLAMLPVCLLVMSLKGTLLEQAPAGIFVWFCIGICFAALDSRGSVSNESKSSKPASARV